MKKSIILSLWCFLIMASSCKVQPIPARDSVDPTLFLQTTKGIGNHMIKSNDTPSIFDTQAIQLVRDMEYSANYGFNDAGGVKRATMEIPANSQFVIREPLPGPWTFLSPSYETPNGPRTLIWQGDRDNPINGYLLPFTFTPKTRTPTSTEEFQLVFTVVDYHDNTTTKTLTVRVGGGPKGLVAL